MSTVQANSHKYPALDRPDHDDSTVNANMRSPNLTRRPTNHQQATQLDQIDETEVMTNLHRPIDTLQTD